MTDSAPKSYSSDPALYLYTSLTSGSSHIVTATSRLETILKANRIPFKALDIATDEKARMIWGRRAGKDETGRVRKIPGLVQMGTVLGDLVEIEEWNEYGELKQHVTIVPNPGTPVKSTVPTPSNTPAKTSVLQENKKPEPLAESSQAAETPKSPTANAPNTISLALRQVGQEAAQKAKDIKKKVPETFAGVGQAEPVKAEKEKAVLAPIAVSAAAPASPTGKHTIDTASSIQSPTSTAWRKAPESRGRPATPRHSIDVLESLQSPNSTAWKPVDVNPPILTHRGSSLSIASAEEIKQVEEEEAIPEEDDEDDEEDDEEDEDE
ncbi:hypothetical protein G7Y89_g2671 [Cudoniella acicularis]|uniref:Uncharacterized protein n=1 Tax=Cudoniella acicularis TaxID=354080 RepID=A0A8H4W6B1_9HELO|nr:hypothetical protein G7Y89_g2671 [Cudoniella acicularis]